LVSIGIVGSSSRVLIALLAALQEVPAALAAGRAGALGRVPALSAARAVG